LIPNIEHLPYLYPLEPTRYILIAAFIIQGLGLLIAGYRLSGSGIAAWGDHTIGKFWFLSGKIGLFTSWTLCLVKAIVPRMGWYQTPFLMAVAGTIVLCLGTFVLVVAFFGLKNSLRVGLPKEETSLITSGIYAWSRNPIYLGVFMICIASMLYFPDPVNIVLAVYGIVIHYRITLGEERFLEQRFGEEWDAYRQKVRRYM